MAELKTQRILARGRHFSLGEVKLALAKAQASGAPENAVVTVDHTPCGTAVDVIWYGA